MSERSPQTGVDGGVLADRVDCEPPAILGLTTTELMIVAVFVGLICLPVLVVFGALIGLTNIALSLTGFAFMGGIWLGSVIFRKLKRGRPHGYYQVRFSILAQRTFGGNRFLLRSGRWDLGRNQTPRHTE